MIRKYLLPFLALLGFLHAVRVVFAGSQPVVASQPIANPSQSPYPSAIAGAGIVESSSENISIGTMIPGVVAAVNVVAGQRVTKGDALFSIDSREAQAEVEAKQAALSAAEARLAKLRAMPRAEDIPVSEARVREAEANLADAQHQYERWQQVADARAVSADELSRKKYALQMATAKAEAAKAELALLKAGAWKQDLLVAEADAATAKAAAEAARVTLDRHTVRAPIDGEVLQVKVRVGEFAQTGTLIQPLIVLGKVDTMHVRVDIDENDAWRLTPGSPAVANVRGNPKLSTELTYVRIEPLVVPKRSLTGDSTERVDTRVLQILYSFDSSKLPVYTGQLMDVFIKANPGQTEPKN
ncbi:MAG: HlyD family efflux transporter periplasmic adaptor subunit [Oligoflexia bacterium]|nr:HlyD family efflux transporter periplasmic adaptor subunit [Oligoflexia bacterium]